MNKKTTKTMLEINPKIWDVVENFYIAHDIEIVSDAHRFNEEIRFLVIREYCTGDFYDDNGVDLAGDKFPKYFSDWMQRTFHKQAIDESEIPLFIEGLSRKICDDVSKICSNMTDKYNKHTLNLELQNDRNS